MEPLVLIVGPAGAGKATAVKSASSDSTVSTDTLDCGHFEWPDGRRIGLCAVHAQTAVEHDLRLRAVGVVVLCDGMAPDAEIVLAQHVRNFRVHASDHTLVVGITRTDSLCSTTVNSITAKMRQMDSNIPILEVDARDRLQVTILLRMLMERVEARSLRDLDD